MLEMQEPQLGQIIRWNGNLISVQPINYDTLRFWEGSKKWRDGWENSPKWNMEPDVINETVKFWESSKIQRQVWNL